MSDFSGLVFFSGLCHSFDDLLCLDLTVDMMFV